VYSGICTVDLKFKQYVVHMDGKFYNWFLDHGSLNRNTEHFWHKNTRIVRPVIQ